METGTDGLEDEAVRRAKNGSDTLLIFMLKARRPEKFKERYSSEQKITSDNSFEAWLDRIHADDKRRMEEFGAFYEWVEALDHEQKKQLMDKGQALLQDGERSISGLS